MLSFSNGKQVFRNCESSDKLSIIIAGDTCPWQDAAESVKNGWSKEILKDIQPYLDDADISIIQWETPLTDDDTPILKSGPNLKCPPECVDFAQAGGFDIALLANNHTGDFGQAPVMQTVGLLEKNGIKTVGAGKNITEAVKPLYLEKNGFRIAVVNVAEHEFGTAGKNKAGCAPLEPLDNIKVIKKAASESDIALIFIHGGNEHNPVPSPRMVRTYRAFAEAGAAAVINIHAHCPQGIELWDGVPVIYCPGNFFFPSLWQDFNAKNFWWTGYLTKLSFDRQGVSALEITPYMFSPDPYKIVPFTGEKREKFCKYLSEISAIITNNEVQKYFDAWCAMTGPDQIRSIQSFSQGDPKQLMSLRNHFTCEAHNELKTNYLRMLEEERIAEAEKLLPELQRLQLADF
ncbi:MAG: CapA family protein [Victivallaceae bacterium]|nr:CapA family protein [Victivallaceae bacterium]